MICPKCEKGNLENVILKSTGEKAHLCDFCETLWLLGEVINTDSGHKLRSFSRGEEIDSAVRYLGGDINV